VLLSLLPLVVAWPSYIECATDDQTQIKVGTQIMGVGMTKASGVTMQAMRNGAPVTSHIQGELLELVISGYKPASAVLVRGDDASNATLSSHGDGATLGSTCDSQMVTADSVKTGGTKFSLFFRPGCTGKTDNITLQFVGVTNYGSPVELTELILSPEMDGAAVKQDPSCSGGPIPTPPKPVEQSTTYANLVWVHRWAVVLTWTLLFPLGVSLVRHYPTGSRLKWHRYIQSVGLLVEGIQLGCIIAAHHIGSEGLGPLEGDGDFSGVMGSAPTLTHKQRGLFIDICVVMQLILGVVRPQPYPNSFLRRVWMWAHRIIGDGVIVLAWINLWEALGAWFGTPLVSMTIAVPFVLMITTALLVPAFLMFKASKAEQLKEQSNDEEGEARDVVVRMPTDLIKNSSNFFGCGHCDQVFTERRILEVHTRFMHPDKSYKEVLAPMPRRFAEVMNTPAVMEGVPLSEVKKHNHRTDCWCVINGKVYDLSSFVDSHPGGPNPILSWAGRDASKTWNLIHKPAWLAQYADKFECLGSLAPEPPVEGMSPMAGNLRNRRLDSHKESTATANSQASTTLLTSAVPPQFLIDR